MQDADASMTARGGPDWPTLWVALGCLGLWGGALLLPVGWGVLAVVMLVISLTLHSSLTHELLHGAPIRNVKLQTAIGAFQPGLFVPYMRFRRLHLAHHQDARLTDPYDDPETNYLDPNVWTALPTWRKGLMQINNTLLGRIVIGPILGTFSFMLEDARQIKAGDKTVLSDWLLHIPGVVVTFWLLSFSNLSIVGYILACYGALAILKIRTFLEHRAHDRASGRTVVIDDQGPLALLFLNNNYHVVHHMHPSVSWFRLPALFRTNRDHYLRRNDSYFYRSYAQVFRLYFVKAKDPVPHPLWPQE